MTKILVVDDSPVDLQVAAGFVREAGFEALFAENGQVALELLDSDHPDLVLTDLQMPVMDGLALVRTIQEEHPDVPVILMTAHGSEQIAVEALRAGASHYVPKGNLRHDLPNALEVVLDAMAAARERERVRDFLEAQDSHFVLGYEAGASRALVSHLQDSLVHMSLCQGSDRIRVGTALKEALDNAIDHGNLELDSALREESFQRYFEEGERRKTIEPYASRRVHVAVHLTPEAARFVVRDEGKGFDVGSLPDPRRPENLLRSSGRGVMLIRTFMDEVSFNEAGNEITMVMRTRP